MPGRLLPCAAPAGLRDVEVDAEAEDFSDPSPLRVFPGLPDLLGLCALLTGSTSSPPGNTVWYVMEVELSSSCDVPD